MRLVFEYIATIGFAYYVYAQFEHAVHASDLLPSVGGVAVAGFLIKHYGIQFLIDLGRIISSWGHALQRLGMILLAVPENIKALFNPPDNDSTLDRLGWENRFNRRLLGALCVVIVFLSCALFVTWRHNPSVREAKIERVTPPPAPQPFDKRWRAPGEVEGIGGPPPADDAQTQPSSIKIDGQQKAVQQNASRPKKPRFRAMRDPWDFPRF